MQVIKRDGSKQEFDFNKIKNAVNSAFQSVYKRNAPEELLNDLKIVSKTFSDNINIEEIQNFVENALMDSKYFDVAREYITYRDKHNNIRN